MLSIISPAKTQDFVSPILNLPTILPCFNDKTQYLLERCKNLTKSQLKKLMNVSDKLAEINYHRFQDFNNHIDKPALLAYNGDVYNKYR